MNFLIFGGVGIGDTIFELSLAKGLKRCIPNSSVDLLVSNSLHSYDAICGVLSCQDYIRDCFYYSRDLFKTSFLLLKLKMKRYDYCFAYMPSFKASETPSKLARLIGCKSIINKINEKTGRISIPVENIPENINIIKRYECLFNILCPGENLDIEVLNPKKVEGLIKIDTQDRPVVTLCLGTNITIYKEKGAIIKKNIKEWPMDRFCKLANDLDDQGYKVLFIGGSTERERLKSKTIRLKSSVDTSFVGTTTVRESIAILALSDLAVGADTGMMHCAAALGKRTLSLFGGTDPEEWRPYSSLNKVIVAKTKCAPCYGKSHAIRCIKRECMESISEKEVLMQINEELRSKA